MEILLARRMSSSRSMANALLRVRIERTRRKERSPKDTTGYSRTDGDPSFGKCFVILGGARSHAESGRTSMVQPTEPADLSREEREIAGIYAEHYQLLEYVAMRRFHVPMDDVQPLV